MVGLGYSDSNTSIRGRIINIPVCAVKAEQAGMLIILPLCEFCGEVLDP